MANRYQKEIEEILKQAGELAPARGPRGPNRGLLRLIRLYITRFIGGKTRSISPSRIMVVSVFLILAALILRPLAAPLAVAGLLLFVVGYAMFFIKPHQKVEKMWRGQPLDDSGGSWWDRFRRRPK